MFRFLMNVVVSIVTSTLGLIVVGWLVPGVDLQPGGFLVAVGVFTLAQAILSPFVFSMARQYAAPILGGIGLVSTFLALFIATLFPGGLSISGVLAWVLATLIVWIITALGVWILMGIVLKKHAAKRQAASA